MHLHRLAAIAALLIATPLLSGCDDYCSSIHSPSIFCSNGPGATEAPAGFGCQDLPGENLWECNVDSALGEHLPGVSAPAPGMCGVVACAKDASNAKQQAAALAGVSADDPRLSCISLGTNILSVNHGLNVAGETFNAPGAVCVHKEGPGCNPCDDGQGGALQNVGEHCGGPYACCQGLTCVGAMASTMGTCQGTIQCPQAQPTLVPLTTTRLRAIAAANGIGMGQTGITQSRTIGLAFQTWVLFMLPQNENKMPYPSQARQMANSNKGGLPGSVIPDYVTALALFGPSPESVCGEVKAVTGTLTPASNQSQILGLIDVASQSPAGTSTHPPPALVFTTTGNTTLNSGVPTTGTQYNVAVWQQLVYEDATIQNDPNPDLYLWDTVCLNPTVYGVPAVPQVQRSGAHSKLTAPTVQLTPIPGDPDPPEVD